MISMYCVVEMSTLVRMLTSWPGPIPVQGSCASTPLWCARSELLASLLTELTGYGDVLPKYDVDR